LKNNTKHENGQKQKGPNEWITLVHTNKQKEDKQISQKGMMGKKQNKPLSNKKHKQKRKATIIGFLLPKVLKIWPYTQWS
jgi:hypothetical protein